MSPQRVQWPAVTTRRRTRRITSGREALLYYEDRDIARFNERIDKTDTCWLWLGSTTRDGYGNFSIGKARTRAHQFAYTVASGPIPPGLEIDHLCRVRACVNPEHLEAVTHLENIRRGNVGYRKFWTHCKYGHEFTPENTYRTPDGKGRGCRICMRARNKRARDLMRRPS